MVQQYAINTEKIDDLKELAVFLILFPKKENRKFLNFILQKISYIAYLLKLFCVMFCVNNMVLQILK